MIYEVLVEIRHHHGIADPEGATIERALPALGFSSVHDVRAGRAIRFQVDAEDAGTARGEAEELCRKLLVNPVLDSATITVTDPAGNGAS